MRGRHVWVPTGPELNSFLVYSREEVKSLTDKVMSMAKADAVEVEFSGGERSATRFANSNITANMVQFDRTLSVTVYYGTKSATATARDLDDASLSQAVEDAQKRAQSARENADMLPLVEGPQDYIAVDAALPSGVNYGPAERARAVRQSLDICEKKGVLGSGYIPKVHLTTCSANSKGLFAYYQYAEAGFILTCRTSDGAGSGWAGITGVKDAGLIDAVRLTEIASDKALKSRKPRALEPGRYTVILEPRPAARFLSLMMGLFNARTAEGPVGNYFSGKTPGTTKAGEKLFSELVTLKSDIGNPILRQTPVGTDGMAARPVTWVEKGILKNLSYDRQWATRQKKDPTPASPNMSLVLEGSATTVDQMIKTTRRGLLVTFFWYIRPVDPQTLLNTGMTRDGLFLIENGEVVGPVQNFRWNMSPLVGFNNVTAVGQPVPIHTGESYDGPGTALVPPVRMEDFYMTSVSPAV
jgi:predicted Zn-dependent protease